MRANGNVVFGLSTSFYWRIFRIALRIRADGDYAFRLHNSFTWKIFRSALRIRADGECTFRLSNSFTWTLFRSAIRRINYSFCIKLLCFSYLLSSCFVLRSRTTTFSSRYFTLSSVRMNHQQVLLHSSEVPPRGSEFLRPFAFLHFVVCGVLGEGYRVFT